MRNNPINLTILVLIIIPYIQLEILTVQKEIAIGSERNYFLTYGPINAHFGRKAVFSRKPFGNYKYIIWRSFENGSDS